MRSVLLLLVLVVGVCPAEAQTPNSAEPAPIADNSFLIEEAYNQEAGVVQHINTFTYTRGGNFNYTFTQEFPAPDVRHQLSYTIPVQRAGDAGGNRGVGDIALNYRYQLINDKRIAIAPRASVLLPTGDEAKGFGAGGTSHQFNLPISTRLARRFVAHTNAGLTFTPHARNATGERAATHGYNFGQSLVWLTAPRFNVLVEAIYNSTEAVVAARRTTRDEQFLVNPGVRWAYNFRNGLQIVPGVAVPFGIGASRGERGVFFYLSFEHPFKKQSE